MNGDQVSIRPANVSDAAAIAEIYNRAICITTATFDTVEQTLEQRTKWLANHGPRYPVVVATVGDEVVGWGSLSPYGIRPGWRFTVENAIYVASEYRGRGIGRAILEHLVAQARDLGYHAVIAQVVGGNEASSRLHKRCGFQTVGILKEAGNKFDEWLDVILMERLIEPKA